MITHDDVDSAAANLPEPYITQYDDVLLLLAGFKMGIAPSVLWREMPDGTKWQAIVDGGQYVHFIHHSRDFKREPQRTMTRQEFKELFGV